MSVLMWLACAAAVGAGAIGWMSAEAHGYRMREQEVISDRLPQSFDGYRILVGINLIIAGLHSYAGTD